MSKIDYIGNMACGRTQRGIAVIEAAIVLPVVIFVMLAVAEFGHAIQQYNRLTQAVRDGARYIAEEAEAGPGIVLLTDAKILAAQNLVAYGVEGGGATVSVLPGMDISNVSVTAINDADVLVSASWDYEPIFFNLPALTGTGSPGGGAFTMNADVTMRIL